MSKTVTACILVIGNEILSGRTKDANLPFLAEGLNALGIQVREARVVPDIEGEIVDAVNAVRARYDYVFTTGGIGPTHDDITADCIARAFGVPIGYHPDAYALLERHYATTGAEFNDARKRMARTPEGASLIENPVSKAPGFRIGNVFVLAGVPMICQAMFESLRPELVGGDPVQSISIGVFLGEGIMAAGLGEIQQRHPGVDIGSYPFYRDKRYGTTIVSRGQDRAALESAAEEVRALMRREGGEPVEDPAG